MNTPLFLLRCLEIGLSIRDPDPLTVGMVLDLWTEKANDTVVTSRDGGMTLIAGQKEYDSF
ncbi:MAG: hypothetical protein IJ899_18490 [Blautia sp.]|nr:hypothetical protein [Blautia sp.]